MTADILTPAVMEWAGRAAPGARVIRCAVRPLAGGAVARRVDQVTLHLTGHHDPLELVRKEAHAHEIAGLIDALAALHARYHGAAGLPTVIPRVTPAWWQALCREWVAPRLGEHAARHPPETGARARALVSRAASVPAATALLAGLRPTLLHGDVHPGNVLVHAD